MPRKYFIKNKCRVGNAHHRAITEGINGGLFPPYKNWHRIARHFYAGFTLVELILVIVLTGILAAIGSQMLGKTLQSFVFSKDVTKGDWQARVALERLTRDLRMARSSTNLTITPATAITFSDTDGNNINYTLSSGSLMRNSQVLADNISNLQFTYLRSDGNTAETTTPALVYYITTSLTVSRSSANTNLRATVHPRNF